LGQNVNSRDPSPTGWDLAAPLARLAIQLIPEQEQSIQAVVKVSPEEALDTAVAAVQTVAAPASRDHSGTR
jgi:hypothetical protein